MSRNPSNRIYGEQDMLRKMMAPTPTKSLLHIIPTMNPAAGGVCQALRNLCPTTEAFGNESEVLCLDGCNQDFGVSDPFTVHRIGQGRGPWSYNASLQPWLRSNAKRYDAVIIHGLWLYHSYAAARVIDELRRQCDAPKVFVMPHGMLDPWFQRDPSRRLKAARNWVYWKLIESQVISRSDGLLFTCQRELELARETFRPYQPAQEFNVGFGIPEPPRETQQMREAFRQACPQLEGRPYLLFLGRIDPKKGVDLLIRAYAQLCRERGDGLERPDLVIAGPTDSKYANEMQQLVRQLSLDGGGRPSARSGAEPRVVFSGMLRDDAKWGAFYGCEAFVLTSHQENFGIAVAEALGCGKPVLISDQINIHFEVASSHAGLVESDTPSGAASLLDRWCHLTDAERGLMRQAAHRCFHHHFTIDVAAENLIRATLDTAA